MNKEQNKRLSEIVLPGDLVYTAYPNWISRGISMFQRKRLNSWASELSHVGFINCYGDMTESSISRDGYKLVSGIHVRPLKAWMTGKKASMIVVQRFNLSEDKLKRITEVAMRLKLKGVKYPIIELAGTALMIAKYNLLKALGKTGEAEKVLDQGNPFDNRNAHYCIAFATHCYAEAGKKLVRSENICTVGEGIVYGKGEIIKLA